MKGASPFSFNFYLDSCANVFRLHETSIWKTSLAFLYLSSFFLLPMI